MTTVYYVNKGNLNIVGGGPLPPAAGDTTGTVESAVVTPRPGQQDVEAMAHKKRKPGLFSSKRGRNSITTSNPQSQENKSVDKRSMVAKMRLRKKSAVSCGNDGDEKVPTADAPIKHLKRPASRKPPRFPRNWFEGKKIDNKGLTIIEPERKSAELGLVIPVTPRERRNLRGASSPNEFDNITRKKDVSQEKEQGTGATKCNSSNKVESGLRVQVFDSPVAAQRRVSVTLLDTNKTVQVQGENIEPFLAIILREAIRNNQSVHIENGVVGDCDQKTHDSSAHSVQKSVSFVGMRSFTAQDGSESAVFHQEKKSRILKQGEMYMKKVNSFGRKLVDSKETNFLQSLESSSNKQSLLEEVSSIVNKMKAKEGLFDLTIDEVDNGDVYVVPPKTSFYTLPAIFSNINSNTSQDWGRQKMSIGQIISSNMVKSSSVDTQDKSIGPQASFSNYHDSFHCLTFGFPGVVANMDPFEACLGGTSSTKPSTTGDAVQLVPCTRVEAVVDDNLGISEDYDQHERVPMNQPAINSSHESANSFEENLPSSDYLSVPRHLGQSFLGQVVKPIMPPPSGKQDKCKIFQSLEGVVFNEVEQHSFGNAQNESIDIIDMHRRGLETSSVNENAETKDGGAFVWLASLLPEQSATFQALKMFDAVHIFSLLGFGDERKRNHDDLDAFYRDDMMFTQTKPVKAIQEGPPTKEKLVSKDSEVEDGRKYHLNEPQSRKSDHNSQDALEIKSTQSVIERIRANSDDRPNEFLPYEIKSMQSIIERIRADSEDLVMDARSEESLHKRLASHEDQASDVEMNKKESVASAMVETATTPVDQVSILLNTVEEKAEAQPSAWGDTVASPADQVSMFSSSVEETTKAPQELNEQLSIDTEPETVIVEPTLLQETQNFTDIETNCTGASQKWTNGTDKESAVYNEPLKERKGCRTIEKPSSELHDAESNESDSARLSLSHVESESCESIEYPSDYSYNEDDEESIAVNVSFAPNFELLRLDKIMSWAQETFSWEAPVSKPNRELKFVAREAPDSLASFSHRSVISSQVGTAKSDLESMCTEETGFLLFEGAGSPLMEAFIFYVEDTIDTLHDANLDAKTPKKAASFA